MCICCCPTRKSLLIYAIVVTAITFIYGIVTIAEFGSSTNVYKILKASIDTYDDLKGGALEINAWNLWTHISNSLDMDDFSDDTLSVTDAKSIQKIMTLTPLDYEKTNYVVLKSLKGIDNGLGVVLFIFSILFLGAEIVYLIFVCGIKESQVLSIKLYSIFNILKIVTYSLSITSIFLSILYGILLLVALVQYSALINLIDSCSLGIILGMAYSYYSFWVYITLSCIFGKERKLFIEVGSVANPGLGARYDPFGKLYVKTVVSSQVVAFNPQIMAKSPLNHPNPNPSQAGVVIQSSERNMNNP